ncbi:methionine adenosyltransferase [Mycoplasma sp. 'Moose RK']|uniref:methionine adenosyltransferase n=1 Tax=Mycoplasma sp. 'Moose RK' TaxID=2780095 RepID=UPI0018C33490|nr:methionine adenosyltransferase [Mycoplasma sp. 'Moose RK']MBG0730704.1 methionine adenosyltransferase [Mycoplasma sp. 'Moose RK']
MQGKSISKISVAESVGKGHPDKICDQISDAILDAILLQDKNARVAIETMASNHLIIIGGELSTSGYVDLIKIAWKILFEIGYSENDFTIISNVNRQSSDISALVDQKSGKIGAGDQGIVYGFATNECPNFMPLAQNLANLLVQKAEKYRLEGKFKNALADMKAQVEIHYINNQPKLKRTIMSIQHKSDFNRTDFVDFVINKIMIPSAKEYNLNLDFEKLVNKSGDFTIGGPIGDTGLTGRKIIVDSYGDAARHGGGAFSGKDYTKVDRTGAYVARWIAKNLVAAGIADEIELQLSFVIGHEAPLSISVGKRKNSRLSDTQIIKVIKENFDLRLGSLISELELWKPIYANLAVYGHFGRQDLILPWEKLNYVEKIKKFVATPKI